MFRIIVNLTVQADKREQFLEGISENAAAAVRDEPGCISFDVCEDTTAANKFVLIETYVDAAAFDDHRNTPHFAVWAQRSQEFVVDKAYTPTDVLITQG
ncbi:MAG: putative quinol monooxygenase [Nitriliruptoraceae bacterium]